MFSVVYGKKRELVILSKGTGKSIEKREMELFLSEGVWPSEVYSTHNYSIKS